MAGNKTTVNSTERMLNLVALLSESTLPLTLEAISNSMRGQYPEKDEARRTAFERDKKSLRKLGIPITTQTLAGSDAGKTAYSIDRTGYALIDFALTSEELSALQQAAAIVQIGTTWGKQAVQWLGGEIVDTELSAAVKVDAQSHVLPALWSAVASCTTVQFSYHGRQREVHPYGLIARNGFWYLIAFDTQRAMQVTYRVDRIEDNITLGAAKSFERPEGFDLATAYKRDPKDFAGAGSEVAIVRLDHRVAPAVIRELGEDAVVSRRTDGSVDVEVASGNRPAFKSWLFAMVDRAEVISPESMRQEIIADLQRMAGGAQ
jgi:predicted DNA-binding transcriptional regulator YafY